MHSALFLLSGLAGLVAVGASPISLPSPNYIPKKPIRPTAPTCDTSNASTSSMPQSSSPLPAVTAGLKLLGVSLGHGTQNYTCADATSASVPAAVGALATLYEATCFAISPNPIIKAAFAAAPAAALASPPFSQPTSTQAISGHHYFITTTTPAFDMIGLGFVTNTKLASVPAPAGANPGVKPGQTNGAVAWLKLERVAAGEVGKVQEIYRVNTAGGAPPATCDGQPAAFQFDYAAEYWFWG